MVELRTRQKEVFSRGQGLVSPCNAPYLHGVGMPVPSPCIDKTPNERKGRMEMIYRDSEGRLCPLITVDVYRGCWIAKDGCPDSERDVNNILQKKPYNGISDMEWIIESMQRLGFDRCAQQSDPMRDPAPSHTMVFDHKETASAMKVPS